MNINEANKIFRKSIIKGFFEPQLVNLDFKKSAVKHPVINDDGLMQSDLLHVFFDVDTGSDYPDADEWFIIELLPYHLDPEKLPSDILEISYKFDPQTARWRLNTAKSENKKYTFTGDQWNPII